MLSADLANLKSIVETWGVRRKGLATKGQSWDGFGEFAAVHNALTKQMISTLQVQDPDFYSALMELASHASTHLSKGRFYVNGRDRTND